jgi:hypothetical protein
MDDYVGMQGHAALDRGYSVPSQKIAEPLGAKLARIFDMAAKVAQSAEALRDRIDGPRAEMEDVSGGLAPPAPGHLLAVAGRIEDRLQHAVASLEKLHSLT